MEFASGSGVIGGGAWRHDQAGAEFQNMGRKADESLGSSMGGTTQEELAEIDRSNQR